jgi:hypothetical protein
MDNEILQKVLVSVITALTLGSLTLLFESVRNALFYFRVEYDLDYEKDSGHCEWDFTWEDYRLTLSVEDVSEDRLKTVKFTRLKKQNEDIPEVFTKDEFSPLFNKEIFFKVKSIVRKKQENNGSYTIKLVLRRKRF